MTQTTARRRGHGEDAIYFDAAKNRYVGAVSLGFGPDGKRKRRKVTGSTKAEVRDKLKALHAELDRGLRTSSTYTVQKAVDDWLQGGLPGRSERTHSVYREALKPLMGQIGNTPLKELTAGDVRAGAQPAERPPSGHARAQPSRPEGAHTPPVSPSVVGVFRPRIVSCLSWRYPPAPTPPP